MLKKAVSFLLFSLFQLGAISFGMNTQKNKTLLLAAETVVSLSIDNGSYSKNQLHHTPLLAKAKLTKTLLVEDTSIKKNDLVYFISYKEGYNSSPKAQLKTLVKKENLQLKSNLN